MRFARRVSSFVLAAVFALASARVEAAPTALVFDVGHSDCTGPGTHVINLYVNETLVATVPTAHDCTCHADSLVVTLTDPATLALVDPAACNSLRVEVPSGGRNVRFAWIRATLETDAGSMGKCLYDGLPWNEFLVCGPRTTCDTPGEIRYMLPIGGADSDTDGVVGGFGTGCDNCPLAYNAGQEDGDGDGIGDVCDVCPTIFDPEQADADGDTLGDACDACPEAGDWDGDGLCDTRDNCPFISNPSQADADQDGVGDDCDTCSCDDADPCTIDSCDAAGCVHAPVVCAGEASACNEASACDPTTGECVVSPKPDGTACDDGNACTDGDACQAGGCAAGQPIGCAASDACHDAGVCDPATGQCSNPVKPDGTSCEDGNACTFGESCRSGVCEGEAVTCYTVGDACHEVAVCDPASGLCVNPPKPDGTPCDDDDACTEADGCRAGTCTGDPLVCDVPDACHWATCKPRSGRCKIKKVRPFRQCLVEHGLAKGNNGKKGKKD